MDEADELGDVVAIMVAGQIRCADAPAALKRSLGWGAKLVVEVLEDTDARDAVSDGPRPTTPPDAHAEGEIQLRAPSPEPASGGAKPNGAPQQLMDRVAAIVQRTAPGARAWERRFDDDGDDMSRQRVIARTARVWSLRCPPTRPSPRAWKPEALPVRVGVGGTDLEDVFLRVGDEEERRRANLLSRGAAAGAGLRALRRRQRVARAAKTVAGLVTKRLRTALARSRKDGTVRRLTHRAAVVVRQRAGTRRSSARGRSPRTRRRASSACSASCRSWA